MTGNGEHTNYMVMTGGWCIIVIDILKRFCGCQIGMNSWCIAAATPQPSGMREGKYADAVEVSSIILS